MFKFLKLPKDSRTRSLLFLGIAVVVVIGVFFYVRSGSLPSQYRSQVGQVPEVSNVPGQKLSPEYYRALVRANEIKAKNAEVSGNSSMATLINTQGNHFATNDTCAAQCCSCENANVNASITKLMEEGKLSPEDANTLTNLANQNVPVSEYASELDQLVKSGRLTPAQARQLLAQYQQQHANQTAKAGEALMDNLIKSGALPVDAANSLLALQKKGVSASQYADALQQLVREGKISPQTAARLLAQYQQQHQAQLNQTAAAQLQALEKSGLVPPDAGRALAALQAQNVPVSQYADELQRLVREGKISPETAKRLLQQYEAAHGGATADNASLADAAQQQIAQMESSGSLSPDAAKQLLQMQHDNVPVSDYQAALRRLVAEGKLSPEAANQLLSAYRQLHAASGADQTAAQLKQAAADQLQADVAEGTIPADVASDLSALQNQDVPVSDYAAELNRLVKAGKLTPAQAKALLASYTKAHDAGTKPGSVSRIAEQAANELASLEASGKVSPAVAKKLLGLQEKNIPVSDYAAKLQQLVRSGALSPTAANQLLEEYKRAHAAEKLASVNGLGRAALSPVTNAAFSAMPTSADDNLPSDQGGNFDALQQRMAAASSLQQQNAMSQEELQQKQDALLAAQTAHQTKVQTLSDSMKMQAGNIVKSFDVPTVVVEAAQETSSASTTNGNSSANAAAGPVLVKAGEVEFAVLDTAVNSDYPQSPIMARIVQGKLKGGKLLGQLITGVGTNADRVILNFTALSMPNWPKSVSISAYAIDPNTARSAMATSVNHHYLLRYSALFASSFLQGYASSLTQAGTTTISLDSGAIQQTHPTLSPRERMWVGLGQVGQNAASSAQDTFNMPPTVKVKSGVGLGILFMQDIAAPVPNA